MGCKHEPFYINVCRFLYTYTRPLYGECIRPINTVTYVKHPWLHFVDINSTLNATMPNSFKSKLSQLDVDPFLIKEVCAVKVLLVWLIQSMVWLPWCNLKLNWKLWTHIWLLEEGYYIFERGTQLNNSSIMDPLLQPFWEKKYDYTAAESTSFNHSCTSKCNKCPRHHRI